MLTKLLAHGGAMMFLLLGLSALMIVTIIERILYLHREQINSTEFLNGVRTVLKRDNVVEAISICDATPGPVARMVKAAILSRDSGREGVREALEEAGAAEVPRLEAKLNLLATVAQIAPVLGLLGSVLGFIDLFSAIEAQGRFARFEHLAGGVWKSLVCTALGLAVSVPAYAAYNYLVVRVNGIVNELERSSAEVLNMVTDRNGSKAP